MLTRLHGGLFLFAILIVLMILYHITSIERWYLEWNRGRIPLTKQKSCVNILHHVNVSGFYTYPSDVDLRIIVLTLNRPPSLQKTLDSLQVHVSNVRAR